MGVRKRISSKKGVFLTLISIAIVMIVVLIVSNKSLYNQSDVNTDQLRIMQLNNFLTELRGDYLKRILNIASHRAITSLSIYTLKTGSLLTDINPKFSEVALSGKIGGVDIDSITEENLMQNNTLMDWISKIENVSTATFGSRLNITVNSVNIYQSSPWFVSAVANVSINLTDTTANWTINDLIIITELEITGYQDPLFFYQFKGAYNHTFNRSIVASGQWDTQKLNEHIRRGDYIYRGKNSPSFLMRFTDNAVTSGIVSECCGIESIVDGKKAAQAGVSGIRSSIDRQFLMNADCSKTKLFSVNSVDSAYSPVYFGAESIGMYQVDIKDTSSACPEGTTT